MKENIGSIDGYFQSSFTQPNIFLYLNIDVFSRPGRSQGLLYKHLHRHALMVEDGAFSHKIDYVTILFGDSKSRRASKLHK